MSNLKISIAEGSLLNEKELSAIYGGSCGCACAYANSGGSSTEDNGAANNAGNLHSPGMTHQVLERTEDGGWVECDWWW